MRRGPDRKRTPAQHLAALIRYDPDRADQYAMPWFMVVILAMGLGCVSAVLGRGIIGDASFLDVPVFGVFGSRFYYAWADGKRRDLLLAQFPDALSLIVRAVRVGIPVPEALRAVAREAPEPTAATFDRLEKQLAIGTALEAAVRDMAARNALPEYGFFAAALALQAQTGGGLTATLESLADIIRRRIAMKARGHALSSEARTSAMVLGALPVVTCLMLFATSPDYISVLFTDTGGHALLGAAVLSLMTGMGVMRWIIRKSLS
jgi:tight adherence protein B